MKHFPLHTMWLAVMVACTFIGNASFANEANCATGNCEPASWIFQPSTFSHDPATGARVAQYARVAPVEDLPDPRHVTSGYRRTRTVIRGVDGSVDASYQVQNFANGRGGLDAEWERFHDAWRQSYLSGSFYNQNGAGFGPYGPGFGGPGFGQPGFGYPPYGHPGYGYPPHGGRVYHHRPAGGAR